MDMDVENCFIHLKADLPHNRGFLHVLEVKNSPAMQEMWFQSLGQEDPLAPLFLDSASPIWPTETGYIGEPPTVGGLETR